MIGAGYDMDPNLLTSAEWSQLDALIRAAWGVLAAVIVLAGSLLVALGFLPSLVATHHIPSKALKVRPLFCLTALLSLLAIGILVRYFAANVGVLARFYPRWWI